MVSRAAIVYDGVTTHARTGPIGNRFRYRLRMWLVDLDNVPVMPIGLRWSARFHAADHVGNPTSSIRDNISNAFAAGGVDVTGCRLLMLANPRGLGHAFNPISLHWAIDPEGRCSAVLAEVHNTYGGRHAYVLQPDADGRDEVVKQLDVSPFFGADGRYTIRVSDPGERVLLSVTLHPEVGEPFIATLAARRRKAMSLPAAGLRTATASLRTSGLIRLQGIKLWARGLPVQPRLVGRAPVL